MFKLSPQKNGKWKYSVVLDLNPETGGVQPYYGVILDGKGHLFGVTSRGGKYGFRHRLRDHAVGWVPIFAFCARRQEACCTRDGYLVLATT